MNWVSPQPFQLNSFRVCNTTFPQPLPEDRLYVDQKSFFANVDQAIERSYLGSILDTDDILIYNAG